MLTAFKFLIGFVGATLLFWVGIAYVVYLPAGWPNYRLNLLLIHPTLHAPWAGAVNAEKARADLILAQDAALAKKAKAASDDEVAAANAITDRIEADLSAKLATAQANTRTVIQRIPTYVTAHADAQCVVTHGFVLAHDAAARGDTLAAVPPGSGESVDADSGLKLSAVAATVAGNYGICHQAIDTARAWQGWYADQSAKYEAQRQVAMRAGK